jgi:hypothetical protein
MGMPLTAFLAIVGVALAGNALGFLFAYRAFAKLTREITVAADKFETNESTFALLRSLESMSSHAVRITSDAKAKIVGFEPSVARAQDVYSYGLAVVDTRFERICDIVTEHVGKGMDAFVRPVYRAREVTSRLRVVANRFGAGSDSRIRRQSLYEMDSAAGPVTRR